MKVIDLNKVIPDEVNTNYLRKAVYGDSMSIARVDVRRGETTQPHSHDSEEVIYVLDGSWLFHLPDGDVTVGRDQMLFIPAGVEHSSEVLEDTIALDICSKSRPDWQAGVDKGLHRDPSQFLWAV